MASSPICLVNNQTTANGFIASAGATVTVALQDSAGVTTWSINCISTDGYHTTANINSTKVQNPITHQATFVIPNLSCGLIFRSVINGGLNVNGQVDATCTAEFKVKVLTAAGLTLIAGNETTQGRAEGWGIDFNGWVRALDGAVTTVFGGDLSGTNGNQTVNKIRGRTVANTAPTDAFVLSWNNSLSQWEPKVTVSMTPPGGANNEVQIKSGTGFISATSVLGGSAFLSIGNLPSASGNLRLNSTGTIKALHGGGVTDQTVAMMSASSLYLGTTATNTEQFVSTNIAGSASVSLNVGAVAKISVTSALITLSNVVSFPAALVSPVINQIDKVTNAATGELLVIRAQNETGTTSVGGSFQLQSGTGTTSDGAVRIMNGTTTMIEAAEVAAGRYIVALARKATITTTQMPTNSGDGVVYVANAATAPTANPVSGQILYADATDQILKVRTTAGNIVPLSGDDPETNGLRLTLTTAVPVTTSNVTAATTIYLTPFKSGSISLYDGTTWVRRNTTEISLALGTLVSGKNYDVFAQWNGSAVTLVLSAAWTNDTTRFDTLTRQNGIVVMSGAPNARYVGTLRTTSTTQTEDSDSKRFLYNFYNQAMRHMSVFDVTTSWSYAVTINTWRQVRATATNRVEYVCGDASCDIQASAATQGEGAGTGVTLGAGIGIDSTTVNSAQIYGTRITTTNTIGYASTEYKGYPGLGYHAINWLECANINPATFWGNGSVEARRSGLVAYIKA